MNESQLYEDARLPTSYRWQGKRVLSTRKRPGQLTLAGPEGVSRLPILLRRAELRFDRAYAGAD